MCFLKTSPSPVSQTEGKLLHKNSLRRRTGSWKCLRDKTPWSSTQIQRSVEIPKKPSQQSAKGALCYLPKFPQAPEKKDSQVCRISKNLESLHFMLWICVICHKGHLYYHSQFFMTLHKKRFCFHMPQRHKAWPNYLVNEMSSANHICHSLLSWSFWRHNRFPPLLFLCHEISISHTGTNPPPLILERFWHLGRSHSW